MKTSHWSASVDPFADIQSGGIVCDVYSDSPTDYTDDDYHQRLLYSVKY